MTGTGLRDDTTLGAIRLDWWAASDWNGARNTFGIPGRLRRNPQEHPDEAMLGPSGSIAGCGNTTAQRNCRAIVSRHCRESVFRGFVPACAGEMMRCAPGSAATRGVHPRLRGGERSRIPGRTRRWVHPRLRGGEAWLTTLASSAEGSSPPARGRVDVGADGVLHRGFIPACAGESTPRASPGRARWVHPRLRGGAHRGIFVSDSTPGSSPPARGRADLPPKPLKLPGFIPACAGERSRQTSRKS